MYDLKSFLVVLLPQSTLQNSQCLGIKNTTLYLIGTVFTFDIFFFSSLTLEHT